MADCTSLNIIDILAPTFAGVSILLVFYQIRKNLNWNKKKCAEEALTRFSSGDLFKDVQILESEFEWLILKENRKYEDVIQALEDEKIQELDNVLKEIFRYFETVTIKIKHDVIDEDVCFDYLFSILTNFHIKCDKFVEKEREARNEPCVYEHVTFYGEKWINKRSNKK